VLWCPGLLSLFALFTGVRGNGVLGSSHSLGLLHIGMLRVRISRLLWPWRVSSSAFRRIEPHTKKIG
jgi:hypothetical protein